MNSHCVEQPVQLAPARFRADSGVKGAHHGPDTEVALVEHRRVRQALTKLAESTSCHKYY